MNGQIGVEACGAARRWRPLHCDVSGGFHMSFLRLVGRGLAGVAFQLSEAGFSPCCRYAIAALFSVS